MPFEPALGYSDFYRLRKDGGGYVDKTRLIIDFLGELKQVMLFPRPRRFGKTLNMSTVRYFLEKHEEDRSFLFEGLEVWRSEAARAHFQRYPVISITFKDVKERSWEATMDGLRQQLDTMYREHRYLLDDGHLDRSDAKEFALILGHEASQSTCQYTLSRLSRYLSEHHKAPVLILIDEYDTPIQSGFLNGFYDEAVTFFQNFLSAGLKDNPYLFRGMLTGILRVSRESLFSGLNNVIVRSILEPAYATAYGFTEAEVVQLLNEAGMSERLPEVQSWYDGYLFGGKVIYNPWSVLSFVSSGRLEPHWVNTASNDLLERLLVKKGLGLNRDVEALLRGEPVTRVIDPNLVLPQVDSEDDALWSFLLFSGYLKPMNLTLEDGLWSADLTVPNREVKAVYRGLFSGWLKKGLGSGQLVVELSQLLLKGDTEAFSMLLSRLMVRSMSYQDPAGKEPEKLYHGFIMGLLVFLEPEYTVRSNRESGYGRADVLVSPREPGRPGVVMELKVLHSDWGETLEHALEAAVKQLGERDYKAELEAVGANPIHQWGVVFDGKRVWVKEVEAEDAKAE